MEASAASRTPARGKPVPLPGRLLRLASDERLVDLVRAGSQAAFEVVYDRHHKGILSFCRHMLGSREEAEDALQHTFMAAYRALDGSEHEIQLRPWLYAIARNRCLSMLRARREQPSDDLDERVTEGLSAQVERRADLQELLRDLADLPEDQRAALVLSELGALSHEDIAGVLDCPKDKVKALVFQARTSLQQTREARETSCTEIREMLSTLRGGARRQTKLRRHIADCPGCREFEVEVKRQRRAFAAVLPVVPTLGLKESALAAAFGAKGAAGVTAGAVATGSAVGTVATGGAVAAGGSAALVAKVLVVAALAGGGVAGVGAVRSGGPATDKSPAAGSGGPAYAPVSTPAEDARDQRAARKARAKDRAAKARRRGHTDRGREFAKSRGKGKKRGLLGTQPGKAKSQDRRTHGSERRAQAQARTKGRPKARPQRGPQPTRPHPTRPNAQPKPQPTPRPHPTPQARQPKPNPQSAPEPAPTTEPEPVPTVEP